MTNVQSKLFHKVHADCQQIHFWTNSCSMATFGLLMHTIPFCLRLYAMFYGVSLVSRLMQKSKSNEFKRILDGWLRSAAFLTTNAFSFQLYHCLVRQVLGYFNRFTAVYIPAFLASFTAILIERPARRPLLTLYVANVATETLWRLLETRGLVRSIPHGETYVFAVGISILMYFYRLTGLQQKTQSDAVFKIIQLLLGKQECQVLAPVKEQRTTTKSVHSQESIFLRYFQQFMQFIKQKKHASCPHGSQSCAIYCLNGALRSFGIGVAVQMGIKLLTVVSSRRWRHNFYSDSLQMGNFLGGFTLVYRFVSCALRHTFAKDDARYALPAAFLASYFFKQYPSNTIALYVFWKMLQQVYNKGVDNNLWPNVPAFGMLLYASCTALLFHSAILEPNTMRSSYFRFLYGISGERLGKFDLRPFDEFGYETTKNMQAVLQQLKILIKSPIPINGWA